MADAKISELTAIDAVVAADLFAVVDDPAGTPTTKKATASQIKDYIIGLANTWIATQTITPAANTNALAVTGYSLTGSNAQSLIDLAGTWNTTGTPTAFKLNITNTASNAASLLMDLQAGGTSRLNLNVDGTLRLPAAVTHVFGTSATGLNLSQPNSEFVAILSSSNAAHFGAYGVYLKSDIAVSWSSSSSVAKSGIDLYLYRDAANTLAQRNSTNAQTFRIYNTYTDASNYERGFARWSSNVFEIGCEAAGSGSNRNVYLAAALGSVLIGRNNGDVILGGGGSAVSGYVYLNGNNMAMRSQYALLWSDNATNPYSTTDLGIVRSAAGILALTNSSTGGASLEFREQTAPSAPSTNNVRIYAEDNGSGKTRLMALFATGAAQQIAIEP